jgi:hypothetical protein
MAEEGEGNELEEVLETEIREHMQAASDQLKLAEKAEHELEELKGRHKHEHSVQIVVDGRPYTVEYREHEHLGDLIPRALKEAGVVGRTDDKWQIKWEGNVLDLKTSMSELHLPKDAVLFLSLEVGVLG